MNKFLLINEARTTLNVYDDRKRAIRTLLPLWRAFLKFLQSRGPMPPTIIEIPEQSLRDYANFLDYQDISVDDALIRLAAVLLICRRAGHSAKVLHTIVIPRVRRPVAGRRWESFRARAYEPLKSCELARSRKRRRKREELAQAAASVDGTGEK